MTLPSAASTPSRTSSMPFFDAHNHLHDVSLVAHRGQILTDLAGVGVRGVVVNGTSESDWGDVATLCARAFVTTIDGNETAVSFYPSFGLHPWDAGNRTPDWEQLLILRLDAHPSAGIGEIGLDRWMLDRARVDDSRLSGLRRAPLPEQIEVFRRQLSLAAERNLPASIHCLDAFGALHDVLCSNPRPRRGFLLHAYSGSAELARSFEKLGAYFSFNGAFLDPRKAKLRALYADLPSERLLVETDAPAMPLPLPEADSAQDFAARVFSLPIGPGGAVLNHPANIARTYSALAALRRIDVCTLTNQVAENFQRLFGPE